MTFGNVENHRKTFSIFILHCSGRCAHLQLDSTGKTPSLAKFGFAVVVDVAVDVVRTIEPRSALVLLLLVSYGHVQEELVMRRRWM